MAAISIAKKKHRVPKKVKDDEFAVSLWFILANVLYRIPAAILLLILIFLWSTSTTIISGNMIHVCLSSRKLNLYCISAGTQPNFDIPIPSVNASLNSNIAEKSVDKRSILALYPIREKAKNEGLETVIDDGNIVLENPVPAISKEEEVKANTETETKKSTEDDVETKSAIPAIYNSSNKNMDEELVTALMDVEEQLRIHRSWISSNHRTANCDGRGVYVYDLPSKFNKEIMAQCSDMIPWFDLCNYFTNEALGEPIQKLGKGWFRTHQYALEPIFHSRILKHPCRVYDPDEAKLFYVPFYGGLDILRWHFKNVSDDVKDSLSHELVRWLETQKTWFENSGKDHVFVLGKISWDFRRYNESGWGTRFLEFDEMQNPMKLLIERQPWHPNDIGIPHPTFFHPQTDDDIFNWQQKIISYSRRSFMSFAGAARPDSSKSIRSILIEQCISMSNGDCRFLNCSSGSCDHPESLIELFMESEFCLQPPGDSPTRKSVFDSLISGCIPVFFDPFTAYYQYPWHLPEDHENYSVFIDKDELRNMQANVAERLAQISKDRRDNMRRYIVYKLLPGLVYGASDSKLENFQDAFSITMDNLSGKMDKL